MFMISKKYIYCTVSFNCDNVSLNINILQIYIFKKENRVGYYQMIVIFSYIICISKRDVITLMLDPFKEIGNRI